MTSARGCPVPVIPSNVQMSCSPAPSSPASAQPAHPLGVVCLFSCGEGHELQGVFSMECVNPGKWSSNPPTCTGTKCNCTQNAQSSLKQWRVTKIRLYVIIMLPLHPQHWNAPCLKTPKMAKSTAPAVNQSTTQNASFHAIKIMYYADMSRWPVIVMVTGRERNPLVKVN